MHSALKRGINYDVCKGFHCLHLWNKLGCFSTGTLVAVVIPLKYLTFMKRLPVIQMVLTSWRIPFLFAVTLVSIKLSGVDRARTTEQLLVFAF